MWKKIIILSLCCFFAFEILAENKANDFYQKEFVASISSGIPNLHPHAAYNADEAQILTGLYEGLCVYDPYTLEPLPGLAKDWHVSADGLVWTFTLRDDIVFENGDSITADTFRDSFINLLDPTLNLPYASLLDCVKGVQDYRSGKNMEHDSIGIIVKSDRVLEITLIHAAEHFANILCHHAFSAVHPSQLKAVSQFAHVNYFDGPDTAFHPISSGPFKIKSFTHNTLQLDKNNYYWDKDAVILPSISLLFGEKPDELAEAFNAGNIHWLSSNVNLKLIAATHTIRITPMFATEFFYFKLDIPPFDNDAFREALLLAINYDLLKKDYLIPAKTLIFPLADYPQIDTNTAYDIQKAKKLLEKIAISDLSPVRICLPQGTYYAEQARILKEAWEQLSLTVEVDFLPFSEYYTAVKKNEYHVGVVSWIADFADPLAFLELFRPDSSLNHTGWKNGDYEKIITDASSERDRKKRLHTLSKAEQFLLDNRIIIPLAHIPAINIIDLNEVSGWYINAVNIHPFKFIQFIQPQSLPNIVRVP